MGELGSHELTRDGLFLSMLEALTEDRIAYETSFAPRDAAEEHRRRAAIELQDKYAA